MPEALTPVDYTDQMSFGDTQGSCNGSTNAIIDWIASSQKEWEVRLQSRVCLWRSKFVAGIVVPTALALTVLVVQPVVGALNGDLYLRLQTTRNALVSQEREITKSYDDVTRQIDELRKKQLLLDSYLRQTRDAIRDVERAMGNAQ